MKHFVNTVQADNTVASGGFLEMQYRDGYMDRLMGRPKRTNKHSNLVFVCGQEAYDSGWNSTTPLK